MWNKSVWYNLALIVSRVCRVVCGGYYFLYYGCLSAQNIVYDCLTDIKIIKPGGLCMKKRFTCGHKTILL